MNDIEEYLPSHKMSDLINDNSQLLMVMSRFGISLGFGDQKVDEICTMHDVDCPTFLAVANFISKKNYNAESISLQSLIDYLKRAHNYFLDFNLPLIRRKLIEAIDCSGTDEVAMLILKFYDEYVTEVRRHMGYENQKVFTYVERLIQGEYNSKYSISIFASKHVHFEDKLKELKDIIIRYYPEKSSNLLNAVLFDLINCEQDLNSHCLVEDNIFIPKVEELEQKIKEEHESTLDYDNDSSETSGDKLEILSQREKEIIECVAKGMSNKEIAETLCLSINTVTTHRRNISTKLSIHTPAGLAIYAIVNKLVDIKDLQPTSLK